MPNEIVFLDIFPSFVLWKHKILHKIMQNSHAIFISVEHKSRHHFQRALMTQLLTLMYTSFFENPIISVNYFAHIIFQFIKMSCLFKTKLPGQLYGITRYYPGLLRQSLKSRKIASSDKNAVFQAPEFPFTFGIINQRQRHK